MTDFARAADYGCRHSFGLFARRSVATVEPATTFQEAWSVDHLCFMLGEVFDGRIRRLNINVPPRSLKSLLVSVITPAWLLAHNPSLRIMCVSYSRDLAETFALLTLLIMQSEWFRRTFPDCQLASARPSRSKFRTTQNGSRYAVGIGGAITGLGADIIIIDEPIKAQDALSEAARQRVLDYADNTLWTRLNDRRRGSIVLTMQRLHDDDLAGHLIRRGGWTTAALPAIATEDARYQLSATRFHERRVGDLLHPEREGHAELDEMRRALGSYGFAAQYQQQPIPAAGQLMRREWLRYYMEVPEQFDRIVVSWDTASSTEERADYSVGTVWGRLGDDFYLLEVIRVRREVPELQRVMVDVAADYPIDVFLIEDDGIGRGIWQNLREQRFTRPRPTLNKPSADKVARFMRHLPLIEQGRLFVPGVTAHWLADYIDELIAFPRGRHDDQVDSTSQALDYLARDAARANPMTRRDIQRRDIPRRNIISPPVTF